jgi:DNA-binding NarL/FixJ family response regulator
MEAAQSRKRICCIVLDMRHREEHLLSLKSFLNMSLSPADMATLFGLFLEMKSNRLTKEWFDNLRLSMTEQLMLRFLGAGMTMEEVALNLNTSLKSLYRKRTALYERLGLDNFNEACLFIFKNKLLDQSGRSP